MAEIWLHAKHGRRTPDDIAGHNPRIRGRDVCHARLFRVRSVGNRKHEVLRIVHREGGDEGIEIQFLRVAAIDDLLGCSGLAANAVAGDSGVSGRALLGIERIEVACLLYTSDAADE